MLTPPTYKISSEWLTFTNCIYTVHNPASFCTNYLFLWLGFYQLYLEEPYDDIPSNNEFPIYVVE